MKKTAIAIAISAALVGVSANSMAALVRPHQDRDQSMRTQDRVSAQADSKKINVTWNVLSTLIGMFSGTVDFKVAPAMTLGVLGGVWVLDYGAGNDTSSWWNIGAEANYAFNGHVMQTGWLVNPYVKFTQIKDDETTTSHGYGVGVLFNYQWMWDGGFNIQLGVGPEYISVDTGSWQGKGITLDGKFSLGYAF